MASSSSSSSSTTLSSRSWKYHVFLSFRGEDTRNTFVGHLYSALEQEGINTYKDDETLPRGESIRPSLMKAIEESHIAVIVFSKNYGDSSWCLDELAHIMKCKDSRGQIVMPIFYDVDPSEVRKQKRKYGEAFAKHELENKTKVESWRKALADASNVSGWEPKHIANGDESKGIKQIAVEISQKLHLSTPRANENLIGMSSRLERLKSELQIGSGGVRMIGIWGVGGGGKTTLASSIYDEICRHFDGCCFVQNVREESGRYGLGKLEEDIISKMGVTKVGGERCMIKERLCRRKVLIVLDDVDRLDQLKALAGSHDWFGDESRIIITTRDEHVLTAHRVDVIHNICLLNDDEASKLFHKNALGDDRPMEDYGQLTKEVVSYAGGLPLALTVLGSFLCDKDINEWKSALVRLKEIPDTNILEKLKISYDGLKPVEKDLFLDIACFFRWEKKDTTMEILDDCGFHAVIGVKVLIQKALITISYGRFDMHDLVQEMGHYIVRGEHPKNPEKHSRLWKKEDVPKICAMDATTELDMIEAIRFGYPDDESPMSIYPPPIVANTKNLRWIKWEGDFASHLLSNFPQRTLCHLVLSDSLQKQLWEGYKLLPNLKTIDLQGMYNLNMTPDFGGLPNLERLRLNGCVCLEEIHPSIGCFERLVFLSIEGCSNLKMFPPITRLQKLETLTFFACPQLFKLSTIQQNIGNLPHLLLDNVGDEVASDIESITNSFVNCWRCGCSNLPGVTCCLEDPSIPHNNTNHIGLRFILKDLRNLSLTSSSLGDEEMGFAVWELPNLKTLNLRENGFSRLDFSLLRLPRLKYLNVSGCKELVELSELPSSIAFVEANDCRSLKSFGDISNCKWLWNVSLNGLEKNKLDGDILLDSMLQGNASEDYFINIILKHQIPKRFVGWLFRGTKFTLHLPHDWYDEFCGFLICIVTKIRYFVITVVIKQEVDEDFLFKLWQDYTEVVEPEYDGTTTYVGYVSFDSLRHTAFSKSSYNMISISIEETKYWEVFSTSSHTMTTVSVYNRSWDLYSCVGAELVPRKSNGHQLQTTKVATDCSEFWDKQRENGNTFTIQHDSKSSIKMLLKPYY